MYHTSVVFLVAAALLLPPELIVLIPLVQTIPEWLKERYPWPIQVFNISNYTLDALAAWGVSTLIPTTARADRRRPIARFAVGGLVAALIFVAMNHILVAVILKFGRSHTFRETGLFTAESISIDLVLDVLGVSLAAFWHWNPWLIFAALAPLVVVHRSLSVPQLQAEARVDPKTGLYNARYFATTLAAEIARAARFERPMSLIMADLDLLRDINNSYGHLAGDAVLEGHRGDLPPAAAPLRRPGAVRRRGVLDPPAGDAARAGAGDRRADPPRRRRARVRGRDRERADPRDHLDRRRRLPEGRRRRERADPPGRPRRLPREAPGTQPRPRREHRAAADARPSASAKLRAVAEDGEHTSRRCLPPPSSSSRPRSAAPSRSRTRCTDRRFFSLSLAPRAWSSRSSASRLRRRHRRARLRAQHGLRRPARGPRARRRAVRRCRSSSPRSRARSRSAPSARSQAPRSSTIAPHCRSRSRSASSTGARGATSLHQVVYNIGDDRARRRSRRRRSSRSGAAATATSARLVVAGARHRRRAPSTSS